MNFCRTGFIRSIFGAVIAIVAGFVAMAISFSAVGATVVPARQTSTPPPKPIPVMLPTSAPCWFRIPGYLQLVNLNAVSSVVVSVEYGKEDVYALSFHPLAGEQISGKIARLLVSGAKAEQILTAVQGATRECR